MRLIADCRLEAIARDGPVGVTRLTRSVNLTHNRIEEQEIRRIERAMQDFGLSL
jgi:hypothetical protein